MEIGTTEQLQDETTVRPGRNRISGRGGGGGRNGSNGGGDGPGPNRNDDDDTQEPRVVAKSRILGAFLLLVVLMTFGGLMGAYVVISTNGVAEWKPFALPVQVWVSTAIILLSSMSYHTAKIALDRGDQESARKWLIATTALGAAFISSQLLVWLMLVNQGLYVNGNPYAGFFYMMTVVHAAHVLGGVIALGCIILRSWNPTSDAAELVYRQNLATSVGWYWHLVGGLWIVLLALLGLWK